MDDTLTISTKGLEQDELRRLQAVIQTCRRNRRIRRRYAELRAEVGWLCAIDEIADEECLSSRQVRRIVHGY